MSHWQQQQFVGFVRQHFPDYFIRNKVLEVGSLDINGSVRNHFTDCRYTGLDVAPGPGVDVVCQGQDYAEPAGTFDVVISCEAMEHNPEWVATFDNMIRLCRGGGLIIMTCATTGRAEHGTARTRPEDSPLTVGMGWNYYQNLTATDFRRATRVGELSGAAFFTSRDFSDLYFFGFKPPAAINAWPVICKLKSRFFLKNCLTKGRRTRSLLMRAVGR